MIMAKRMSAKDARSKFSDLLGSVNYGGEEVIVERSGRPVAAVIPVPVYERLVDLLKTDTILVPGRAAIKGAVL